MTTLTLISDPQTATVLLPEFTLIVGIVLLGEGGHGAHLKLFGYAVEPLSKSTFYFSLAVLDGGVLFRDTLNSGIGI